MIRFIRSTHRRTALFLLFLTILLMNSHAEEKMKMRKDREAMKQEIAKQIPIGSGIEDAELIMEANGFECAWRKRRGFTEMFYEKRLADHNDIDFLYCDKEKGGLFCARRWQVGIVHKDGIVSDILVSITRTCL